MSATQDRLIRLIVDARRSAVRASAVPWAHALQCEEDAYQVQHEVGMTMGWFKPAAVQFWKSGGPTRLDAIAHARLSPHTVRPSDASLSDLQLHRPFVAAEIALRVGEDVTPAMASRLTDAGTELLVDSITVALSISDSRWEEQSNTPALLQLADTASHGALVLGEWRPYTRLDWSKQNCEVVVGNSAVVFAGAYGLRDPAWLLPLWLRHATRGGETVPAGSVVTTGSWSGGTACRKGTLASVIFRGLGEAKTLI